MTAYVVVYKKPKQTRLMRVEVENAQGDMEAKTQADLSLSGRALLSSGYLLYGVWPVPPGITV